MDALCPAGAFNLDSGVLSVIFVAAVSVVALECEPARS